jgi:hypothetical protein
MCVAWDPAVAKKCREDDAEEVKAKEQANFCDYFRPRPAAFDSALAAAGQQARSELEALFGAPRSQSASDGGTPGAAESLFGPPRRRND